MVSYRLCRDVLIGADSLDIDFTQLHDLRAIFEGDEGAGNDEQGKVFTKALVSLYGRLFTFVV